MKSRTFVTALAIVGLGIIDAQTANATPRYFDAAGGATGVWNLAANWNATGCGHGGAQGVPVAGDVVIICEDKGVTLDVNTPAIGALHVQAGASVTVPAFTLLIDSNVLSAGVDDTHEIDGEILLTTSTSILKFQSNSAILGGDGTILGSNATAKLQIEGASVRLVNHITIKGEMEITEAATGGILVNKGLIDASSAGNILLIDQVTVEDGEGGVYRVSGTGTLRFASTLTLAADLNSNFELLAATLDIGLDLATTGDLVYEAGTLDCAVSGQVCKFGHAYTR
jgi:hypothetical protein